MDHSLDYFSPPCKLLSGQESGVTADLPCGRTSPEPSAATQAETLQRWLTLWQVWPTRPSHQRGGALKAAPLAPKQWSNGQLSMRSGSEWRKGAVACSLSQTLETGNVGPQYYLSPKACAGILRRAEKRGKVLPEALARALRAVADSAQTSSAVADLFLNDDLF